MNSFKDLNITILSRDRPKYLIQTINSLKKNAKYKLNINISDNSLNKKTIYKIQKKFNNLNFIYRKNNLDIFQHFNLVVKENKKKFLFIAADDDIYDKNFLSSNLKILQTNKIAAVGCNGFLYKKIISKKNIIRNFFKSKKKYIYLNQKDMLLKYIDKDCAGVSPLFGYIYKSKYLKNYLLPSLNKGGTYSDTIFLLKLTKYGIIWNNENLIHVREHDKTVSLSKRFQYKIFINYIKKFHNFKSKIIIQKLKEYRFFNFISLYKFKRKYILIYIKIFLYLFFYSKYLRKRLFLKIFKYD
jgi:hypothetical protein